MFSTIKEHTSKEEIELHNKVVIKEGRKKYRKGRDAKKDQGQTRKEDLKKKSGGGTQNRKVDWWKGTQKIDQKKNQGVRT